MSALLNRSRIEAYEFGRFRLDLVVRRLFYQGRQIHLPSQTFDILEMLLENRERAVTKKELIERVWPDRFVGENNLTVRMSGLRKALGESAENRFIETVSGFGYRFVARAYEVFDESGKAPEDALNSLAVLPLINDDNQQQLNYLCDGIIESLITSLSHMTNLRVMARATVFRYKGREIDPQKIGRELDVQAVLVGTVNKENNHLLFNLELIDVKDGARLWGEQYRRRFTELINLHQEIAREISASLRIKLSRLEENRVTKRHTDNPKAYELYLKGRYFLNKRTIWWARKAIRYFRSAIKQDPRFSLSYVGLADTYIRISGVGWRLAHEFIPKAKAAVLQALEIDEYLAEAHVSLGSIKSNYELDWQGAESEFKLAIGLNPFYPLARHLYATLLVKFGRFEEALAEINNAYEIDPLSLHVNLTMGKIYYFARRYEEAVKKGRDTLEIAPEFGVANGLIGVAYLEMGRVKEAIKEFQVMFDSLSTTPTTRARRGGGTAKRVTQDWDPEALSFMGYAYAVAGKRSKALETLGKLKELMKKRYVQPDSIAIVYTGLGDKDTAFEWLDKALEDRCISLTYIKVFPLFDTLRADPRYEQLLRRLGITA